MKHDISDPVTMASVLVRDHLDTVIVRHGSRKGDAVSAAVHKLATALLQHLPGEVKQLRNDDVTRSRSLAVATGTAHARGRTGDK